MFVYLHYCLQYSFVFKILGSVLIQPSFLKFLHAANCHYFVLRFCLLFSTFNYFILYSCYSQSMGEMAKGFMLY